MTDKEFSRIVEQYERLVFTICHQMVRDYHEAQNLAQETFLSAYRHIDTCPPDSYKPWLARIAANKAKDYLKSAYIRHVAVTEDEQLARLPAGGQAPDSIYIGTETRGIVQDAVDSLREPYLKVSRLYFLEEKSVDEISDLLDRPKKTVQTQLYRARAFLQGMLKEERTR